MRSIGSLFLPFSIAIVFAFTLPSCTKESKKVRSLESAAKHFESGEFPAAEIEYKNALDADPGNPEAIKRLGIIRLRQGAYFEAAGILNHSKKILPKDDEVGVCLAQSLFALGFIPDCRKELMEVLDRSPANEEAISLLADSSLNQEWIKECEARIQAAGSNSPSFQLAEALLELRRGNMENGANLIEGVLKTDPGAPRAHSLKAGILRSKKEPDKALAEQKASADASGTRSPESIAYASMLMAFDRKDEAIGYLKKITSDTPDFLPAWSVLGQIAYGGNDYDAATEYLGKVLSKSPIDMAAAVTQADILLRNKEPGKAAEILVRVSEALPSRPQLEIALAKCYLADEKAQKAATVLDKLLGISPGITEAVILRAQIHLKDGDTAAAITALEAIREREPENSLCRELLIGAYRAAGREDDAIVLLREKAASDTKGPESRVELGQLLWLQGKIDEARSVFEGTLETFGDSLGAVTSLSALDSKEGKHVDALNRINDYIATHPDSSEAFIFKASIELDMKQPEVAEQSLMKALELKADNALAYGLLLRLNSGPGEQEKALAVLDRYLKVFPDDSQASLQRALMMQQLGRNDEAKAALLQVIQASPEFAPAYNNLASLESDVFNDFESAATHARKARSIAPKHPAIADTLGWIEWRLGNYPEALALLTEASAKMSKSPDVLYHLGMAHYSMGQADEAVSAFKQALDIKIDFPGMVDAKKHLTLLQESGKASVAELEKRVSENPNDVISRLQLANQLAVSGRPQEALEAYEKAFEANPAIPTALVGQARLYAGPLKSAEKSLAMANKARELAPRDPKVLAALGSAKLLTGNDSEAYGLLKDASAQMENDFPAIFDYARAAYFLGRIPEARAGMTRVAASEDSKATDAKEFLLLIDEAALERAGITSELEKVLTEDPSNVPALMLRASLAGASGNSPEADYLEILKLHPEFDPARVKLAAYYLEDPAKLDEALALVGKARTSMADDPEVTRILAVANFRKGDFNYAAQLLAEIASKGKLTPDELLVYGLALASSDQPEKALATLDEALKAGLPDADQEKAKAAIAKLKSLESEK